MNYKNTEGDHLMMLVMIAAGTIICAAGLALVTGIIYGFSILI